ncbi:MAG: FAD-dependent oxidoreductase [Desulfuromonadaceae bacterium]|nr:FAD-dependent oxidoreductase [Desulfuromonadaceae bacterium]
MPEETRRIVVIGGVAAGMKTACRLMRVNPSSKVVVIDKCKEISYGACSLPYYIEGLFDNLEEVRMTPVGVVRDEKFFANCKGFEVLTLTEAVAIDRQRKVVRVKNVESGEEREIPYSQVVLASGNRPILPPLPGIDLKGVYPLKTMGHAQGILAKAKSSKKAVVVGGGFIGLEVAEALIHRGLEVTLVEMKDQIMAGLLDGGMAALVHRELRKKGINLRLSEGLQSIEGRDGEVVGIQTSQGRYPADLVIVAIGVRPEVELAKAAGLEIGKTGGLLVDDQMRSSDPDIYGAGDCVESKHLLSGGKVYVPQGSTANKQGRVVADNIAGLKASFPGVLSTLIVKVFDCNVTRTGLLAQEARNCGFDPVTVLVPAADRAHTDPGSKPILIKLTADRASRKILGAQIVGPGDVAKRIDTLVAGITMGITVDQLAQLDLAYAPPFSSAMDPLHQTANALRNKLDGLMESLEPQEVYAKQQKGEDFFFLDVRSPKEFEEVRLSGAQLIPLGALRGRLNELPRDKEIIPFCKISLRGFEAAMILKAAGFSNVRYMEGGILGWPYHMETGKK